MWIVPCQYHGWWMPGRRAGSTFAVYARVQCREPKTGQEKAQFYCEDDSLFLSSYYLFIYGLNNGPPTDYICFRFFVKRIQFFYCCPLHIKPNYWFSGILLSTYGNWLYDTEQWAYAFSRMRWATSGRGKPKLLRIHWQGIRSVCGTRKVHGAFALAWRIWDWAILKC